MEREVLDRIGLNESTFRELNEAIEDGRRHHGDGDLLPFVCECARLGCNRLIELTVPEYEAVRANPRRFAIVDGHEVAEAEVVIERRERFTVIEKHGPAGRAADRAAAGDGR